ncbi:TetR/AcrR family transcriptional regulator [Bacillus aquiflavi]|uniref:TetR/AcrR family transcriptional regulator n=2 Tax=Bacillus aquiflavi TaxID=2672567 RepID=A0A6B3VZC6_9BACI|nr:TetR/AcrR family transcriptional regulator [Bacillus aquiflavi]MBA4537350.1 TetR/AcrR family transcriptional regulator [Bacillus aquiflavi]NEY81607.1 TetR/AcrR family transcriptional regulator [Bacillus aquiflavi]
MNEKKQFILETAMRLFAQNGFHLTSMQEIAEHSGVAKGSLYTYFRSKEDLMISILNYYDNLLQKKILQVEYERTLTPKEMFQKQLSMHFKEFSHDRDFLLVQIREQSFHSNLKIRHFFFKKRKDFLLFTTQKIIQLFGEEVQPYAFDCAIIFHGMVKEYSVLMIKGGYKFSYDELSAFLINRLENVIAGCLVDQKRIVNDTSDYFCIDAKDHSLSFINQIEQLLTKNKNEIGDKKYERAIAITNAMKENLAEEQKIVLEGLLIYLQNLNIPSITKAMEGMEHIINKRC